MKRLFILLTVLLIITGTANCQEKGKSAKADFNVHQWVEKNFAKNAIPPFSFNYGGKESKSFITSWDYTAEIKKSTDPDVVEFVYTYSDKQSGLTVKCFVSCFRDFPAVEWVLKFTNTSVRNSSMLEQTKAIDYLFVSRQEGAFTLYHAKGSDAQRTDFQPLTDELHIGEKYLYDPNRGPLFR